MMSGTIHQGETSGKNTDKKERKNKNPNKNIAKRR